MLVHNLVNLQGEVGTLLNDNKIKEALTVCAREDMSKSYLGHMLSAGLKEFESREDSYGIEAVERAIEKNAITEIASLNKGLNILQQLVPQLHLLDWWELFSGLSMLLVKSVLKVVQT